MIAPESINEEIYYIEKPAQCCFTNRPKQEKRSCFGFCKTNKPFKIHKLEYISLTQNPWVQFRYSMIYAGAITR